MNSLSLRAALLMGCLSVGCSALVSNELDGKPSSSQPGTDASQTPQDAASEDAATDPKAEDQSLVEHEEDTSTEKPEQDVNGEPDVSEEPDVADAPETPEASPEADAPEADAEACPGCEPGLCCGNTCCPGTSCTAPDQCSPTCVLPYLNCNGNIVDGCEVNAATDPDNCGACGNACVFGAQCIGGTCVCPPGTADCDGVASNGCETDISTDPLHCGTCLKTCAAHQDCAVSVCKCAAGFADCDNQPGNGCEVDTTVDGQNCGTCGTVCSLNQACTQSACKCVTGFLDCDAQPGCEATSTSVSTCGACNVQCQLPTPLCGPSGCTNVCPGGETLCGTSCIDTTSDPLNCGGCNVAVGPHQHCAASQIVCDTGWGDCDGLTTNGCEETLTTDTHCGACTTVCKPGAVCSAGTCECAATTPLDCGPSCAACCNDTQCADSDPCTTNTCNGGVCESAACSQKCCVGGCFQCCVTSDCGGGVQTCSGGVCIAGCDTGMTACNGTCVDLTKDPLNCGGCGRACLKGRTCSNSECSPEWVPLPTTGQPSGREWACGVRADSKLFVWGGHVPATATYLNTGGIYDPVTDAWTATNTTGAPVARAKATCVWTGSVVVVWGGGTPGTAVFTTGGRFDPATNSWNPTAMATTAGRFAPIAVWTGSRVLVWGGLSATGGNLKSGGLYDPVGNTWTAMDTAGAPAAVSGLAYAWAGADGLIVFGGEDQNGAVNQDVFQYQPANNKWAKLFTSTATKRSHAFGAWVNSKLFIWGGHDVNNAPLNDGGYLDIVAKSYTPLPVAAPSGGRALVPYESGWFARSGSSLFLIGGVTTGTTVVQGGYVLDTTSSAWTSIPAWNPTGEHRRGAGAWSGSEFMLWGGLNGAVAEMDGSRWLP
ncbi:MAG: hypothetical protein HY898_29800 [Deltaproteobacteria bacterium]|nr:hypothetical protein [Deltaproteobacteria bacterium]